MSKSPRKTLQECLLEQNKRLKFKESQFLVIFNLQNEFASPDGKLPCNNLDFVDRIKKLVPSFRKKAGDIIWIRSEYEADRLVTKHGSEGLDQVMLAGYKPEDLQSPAIDESILPSPVSTAEASNGQRVVKKKKSRHLSNILNYRPTRRKEERVFQQESVDSTPIPIPISPQPGTEELFLTDAHGHERRCGSGTTGAAFIPEIEDIMRPSDLTIVATHYSAAKETNLINALQSKIASEVYVCGCLSNISIYATMAEMVRHGFKLRLIEDCLGYRTLADHEAALVDMLDDEMMGLESIESTVMQEYLDAPDKKTGMENKCEKDITDSMVAMTISSVSDRGRVVMDGAARGSSPSSVLRDNKLRVRSRTSQRQAANTREQLPETSTNKISTKTVDNIPRRIIVSSGDHSAIVEALIKKTAAQSQILPGNSTWPPDTQAQILAAIEKLSIQDETTLQTQSKPRSKSRSKESKSKDKEGANGIETSAESLIELQEGHEPTQPASDSSVPQAILDALKQNKTLLEENSGSTSKTQKIPVQDGESTMEATETERKFSSPPSISTNAKFSSHIPECEVSQSSNSPAILDAAERKSHHATAKKLKNLSSLPTLGPGDKIGEGDSSIRYNLLPSTIRDELDEDLPLSETIFTALYHEVQWQKMYHAAGEVPRLVAVQGVISANGDKPLYRHPSDQAPPLLPFTKNVNIIRKEAEKIVGHELNHVLIQLYRDGKDFISEHSDKTLDIMPGSKIVNASFGAQRTMRLRTKKSGSETAESARQAQRIALPHNSLFALGLISNKIWLHGINPDKRLPAERSPEELAYNGKRISLTFRYIGTFLDKEEKLIWGQGAVGRSKDEARSVINGNEAETERMIQAFSTENREGAGFVWREAYGGGFDVLHFRDGADEQ